MALIFFTMPIPAASGVPFSMPPRNLRATCSSRTRVKERLRAEGRQVVVHYRKPKEERSMRKRWRRHVAALVEIQEQVRDRRERVPPNLEDSPYARAADAFLSIDLSELEANDPPLGYGRD